MISASASARSNGNVKYSAGVLEAVEMELEERESAVPAHRFDEHELVAESDIWQRHILLRAQEFWAFESDIRLYSSAATESMTMPLPTPMVPEWAIYRQCADGNVEGGALLREESYCAGVDAARLVFKLSKQLHGSHFGRASNGATGKECAKHVVELNVSAQFRSDGGRHLPKRGVAFDSKHVFCLHRAEFGQAAQIVTQQVDDHQVFGAILLVVTEFSLRGRDLPAWCASRRSARFHRPGSDAAIAIDAKE